MAIQRVGRIAIQRRRDRPFGSGPAHGGAAIRFPMVAAVARIRATAKRNTASAPSLIPPCDSRTAGCKQRPASKCFFAKVRRELLSRVLQRRKQTKERGSQGKNEREGKERKRKAKGNKPGKEERETNEGKGKENE